MPRSRSSPISIPLPCSSTSACPAWTATRSPAASASSLSPAMPCSSRSPAGDRKGTAYAPPRPASTTTSSSPQRSATCRACSRRFPARLSLAASRRRDEHAEGFAPDDHGVVGARIDVWRHGDDEVLEGLHVAHARHARLEPQEILLRLDELGREVELV